MKQRTVPFSVRVLRTSMRMLGYVLPGLSAAWLYRIWFSTSRYPQSARETRWLQQAQQEIMNINDECIVVYHWGNTTQPRVYLMHGWSGRASQLGAFVAPLLESGFSVIAFDAPGHGKSSGTVTNIYSMANCLAQIIMKYGRPNALIAHSFGCMTVALAINKYNLGPDSIVMISSPTRYESLVEWYIRSLQLPQRMIRHFNARLKRDFGESVYQDMSADVNLKDSKVSSLIIHDRDDREVNWEYSQLLEKVMPNAKPLYTNGLGHWRILRDRILIQNVVTFIREHSHDKN